MATLYENYITGDDAAAGIPNPYTTAGQTFTPQITHTITSVKLKLWRIGSLGTINIGIKAVDGNSHPTGADLCSGTYNGDLITSVSPGDWYEITLGAGTSLTQTIKYAIVITTPNAAGGSSLQWRCDTILATYTGGAFEYYYTGAWNTATDFDFMFEEWGDTYASVTITAPLGELTSETITPTLSLGVTITAPLGELTSATLTPRYVITTAIIAPLGKLTSDVFERIHINTTTQHNIYQGTFRTPTLQNRVYVVGGGINNVSVYSEELTQAEIDLVGEILHFLVESGIVEQSDIDLIAPAILSKLRLHSDLGSMVVPVNCGQELFDVVNVEQDITNQDQDYRIRGRHFLYEPQKSKYIHEFFLTAV